MFKIGDLFRGNRCARCNNRLDQKTEDGLCTSCRLETTLGSLERSSRPSHGPEHPARTTRKTEHIEVQIESVGHFVDAGVAIKTIRTRPGPRHIAWANLNGEGRGDLVVDDISKDCWEGVGPPQVSEDT